MLARDAAAEVKGNVNARPERAGDTKPSTPRGKAPAPANHGPRKSAIITVRDRKAVQRQREQQQMARIVTYIPKRQQDAWHGYLRLTGLKDSEASGAQPWPHDRSQKRHWRSYGDDPLPTGRGPSTTICATNRKG